MKIQKSVKNFNFMMIMVILISGLLIFSSSIAMAKTYNLNFSFATPDTAPLTQKLLVPWAEMVEKETDGQVKITMYPGGTLVKADSMLSGVATGLTDIGWASMSYFKGQLPLLNALVVSGYDFKTSKVASYVDRAFIEEFPESIPDDIKHMYVFSTAPGMIMANKPIQNLEELQGLQINCTGIFPEAFEALGGSPVTMPMAESYESLSKSVIDGAIGPAETLMAWNLAEVVDYAVEVPFLYNSMPSVIMNKDTWNSLPEDIQNTIERVNEEFFTEVAAEEFDKIYLEGIKYGIERGLKIIQLSKEEQERWKEKLIPLQEQYIEKLNNKGLPGREALTRIEELVDKYNKEFEEYNQELDKKVKEIMLNN